MKFLRWISSKLSRSKRRRCRSCFRILTKEELYYYGDCCERCERRISTKVDKELK